MSNHDPRTHLGRPWRARSWLVPLEAWALAAIAAWAVHEARAGGILTVPAGVLAAAGLVVTVVLAAAGIAVAAGDDFTGEIRAVLSGSGLLIGGWLTVVVATDSAWTLLGMFSAVVFGATSALAYCWARHEQRAYEKAGGSAAARRAAERAAAEAAAAVAEPEPEPLTPEQIEAERWERLLTRAGAAGVEYIDRYASKAGPVIHLRLPEDGSITYTSLVGLLDKLEVAVPSQLREFRGIRPAALRFKKARTASGQEITTEVYLHIDVRDILKKVVKLPDDHGPLSVYTALPFGELVDTGETLYLTLCEIHVMIVGQTGQGKSNLLHVLIHQLSRCEDAVLWVYDGKGGRTVRPWLRPWLRRMKNPVTGMPLDRPIFDWVAINRIEAERMFAAAIAAATSRPGLNDYGSKWRATPESPAIFVIADELSQATGNHVGPSYGDDTAVTSAQLDKLITQGVSLGRSEAVWWWTANQRNTVTMGASGDAQSQFGGRIVLPVETADEARSMLAKSGPEAAHLAGRLTSPGSIVVQGFGLPGYELAKLCFAGDDDDLMQVTEKAVLWHTQYRPALDDATAAELAPYGYADRWTDPDRTAWMYGRKPSGPLLRYDVPAKPGQAIPTTPAAGGTATITRKSAADVLGLPPAAAGNPWGRQPATPAPADTAGAAELAPDEAAQWEEIARQYEANGPEPDDDTTAPPPVPEPTATAVPVQPGPRRRADYRRARPLMVESLNKAGAAGMMAVDMYRALSDKHEAPARTNMYDWMARLVADGYAVQPSGATNGRYYHPHHWKG
ncbi:DUF87 domain-containing protein [Micromonospora haikouensis]|uniref:helicase HerA domain-containing protein n=1 Tax=Micromonospora haikouensis TaxID=686309 RepID=UPI00340E2F92